MAGRGAILLKVINKKAGSLWDIGILVSRIYRLQVTGCRVAGYGLQGYRLHGCSGYQAIWLPYPRFQGCPTGRDLKP